MSPIHQVRHTPHCNRNPLHSLYMLPLIAPWQILALCRLATLATMKLYTWFTAWQLLKVPRSCLASLHLRKPLGRGSATAIRNHNIASCIQIIQICPHKQNIDSLERKNVAMTVNHVFGVGSTAILRVCHSLQQRCSISSSRKFSSVSFQFERRWMRTQSK